MQISIKVKSSLRWHGGKYFLADDIIQLMGPHLHYVEPYFGAGHVLFSKSPIGVSEVVNDVYGDLTNFWETLQNVSRFEEFKRVIEATPVSESIFEASKNLLSQGNATELELATAFFVVCRQSMSGRLSSFSPLTRNRVRGKMNAEASAWISSINGLDLVHARLQRVVILNQPALQVIRSQDDVNTLFYLDPPYLLSTRESKDVYEHEMSEQDHIELLDALIGLTGKFLLSGYRSDLYDTYANKYGWKLTEFIVANHSSKSKKKEKKHECIWQN